MDEQIHEEVQDDKEIFTETQNIDNLASEEYLTSNKVETINEGQIEDSQNTESTVRRLSLFDSISANKFNENAIKETDKTEPIISEDNNDKGIDEDDISVDSNEKLEPEFSGNADDLDEDFNQETEEELLDIPTFLRRQAN